MAHGADSTARAGGKIARWMAPGSRSRRLIVGLLVYLVLTAAFFSLAGRERLWAHTPHNHYVLLADSWLHGRLDLGGPPPPYTGNNDFAVHEGKHYVSFPPFPAVVILPVVAYAGSVERVRDGQLFLWLAGIGPAVMVLVFERLRRDGRGSARARLKEWHSVALALLLGLGTVYWFTAVQGTVWFAAHVIAMALAALYILWSLDGAHPFWAGLTLGLAFATRPPLACAAVLFAAEALRAARAVRAAGHDGGWGCLGDADVKDLLRRLGWFLLPAAAVLLLICWHNQLRFGDPLEFGHRLLAITWRRRIDKWGLFSYHYLAKNLGIILTGLPFHSPGGGLQINGHGLALWLTTPLYLWALWPRRPAALYWIMALTAAAVAAPNLLYQNTGWIQFGYRFSNDFAPFLFVMIALSGRRRQGPFWLAAALSIAVNGFGALTFGKQQHSQYYQIDSSQRIIYEPD